MAAVEGKKSICHQNIRKQRVVAPLLLLGLQGDSLAEFRALVSAALDSDAPAPPLARSRRTSTSHPALQRKKSVQNLHAAASSSRVRLMLGKLKKRAAALIVRRRRLSLPISASTSSKAAPSVDSALFRPYLPLAAQYERASTSAPLAFTCAPALAHRLLLLRDQLPLALLPLLQRRSPVLVHPCLHRGGPRAQWGGRIRGHGPVREGRAMPLAPEYSARGEAGASPSRRSRARARELDVELRELSGEVEFAPTQFGGENEEQEEQEIDDSGIFLAEEFVPARSSTPPPSSPSSAAYSPDGSSSSPQRAAGLARAPTPARTYSIAAAPSRHGRNARARARPGSPFPLSRSLSASAGAAGAVMQGDYVR
ncbi:hypothetical protein B0H14DRAFT_2654025 [Mycena olivaceomarginata]|nr:hypothetical protein B0H14DRAFT_2654025 [Mycena olivaceomarginata]